MIYRSYVLFFLDRRDTKNSPFAKKRSALIERISCEGHVAMVSSRGRSKTFLCGKKCVDFSGNSQEKGGFIWRTPHDWRMKRSGHCFFLNGHLYFEMKKRMDGNHTKICPGHKFVPDEYPCIYTCNVYIYNMHRILGVCVLIHRNLRPTSLWRWISVITIRTASWDEYGWRWYDFLSYEITVSGFSLGYFPWGFFTGYNQQYIYSRLYILFYLFCCVSEWAGWAPTLWPL